MKKKQYDVPDEWDPDIESFLDFCARKARESAEDAISPYKSKAGKSSQKNASPVECLDPAIKDLLGHLVDSIRRAETVERQVNAMHVLAIWLEDEADRLLAKDSVNFHRSRDWH